MKIYFIDNNREMLCKASLLSDRLDNISIIKKFQLGTVPTVLKLSPIQSMNIIMNHNIITKMTKDIEYFDNEQLALHSYNLIYYYIKKRELVHLEKNIKELKKHIANIDIKQTLEMYPEYFIGAGDD